MNDTPPFCSQLTASKLPTSRPEYDKLARQRETDVADNLCYLLRLHEVELIERKRRCRMANQAGTVPGRFPSSPTCRFESFRAAHRVLLERRTHTPHPGERRGKT